MENNRYGRLVSVLVSPAKTFRSIAGRPTWLTAMLALIVCSLLIVGMTTSKIDWEEAIDYRLEQKGRDPSPQEEEAVVQFMEQYGTVWMMIVIAVLPWVIYPLAAAIFVGGFRLLGGELRFKASLGVWAHALMPYAVGVLITVPFLIGVDKITVDQLDRGIVIPNLAVLAGEDIGPEWITFLSNFDVFALWSIVLLVIGYSIAARVSRMRAAVLVIGMWAVFIAGMTGLVALDRMLGG